MATVVDGFQPDRHLGHTAPGTQKVLNEQAAATRTPDATSNVHSRPGKVLLAIRVRALSCHPLRAVTVRAKPADCALGEHPLPLVYGNNPGPEVGRGREWVMVGGGLLLSVELFPTYFSNIRLLLPSLLRKRHAFGCVLKNIPYANGMSPSAKEGRAVFKGKTITELRYSQRGTKEPKRR